MKAIALSVCSILLLSLALCPSAMAVVDRINITTVGVGNPPVYAKPNDGIDDSPQINAAILAGRSIYFPAGTYDYAGPMALPANVSYRLYGEGPGVSRIRFTGPGAGINGLNRGQATLNVEGLTLIANSANCGTAISASFSELGSAQKFRTATINNVEIMGSVRTGNDVFASGGYWTHGIYLYKAQNAVIDKLEIAGNIRTQPLLDDDATLTGIIWESSNDYATTGLQVSNLQIRFCNTALKTNGWVEGFYLNNFEIVQCGQHGMPALDLNAFDSANLKPTFHLVNGHVDLIQNGIRLTNLRGIKISKVLLIHNGGAEVDGTMIIFNNCFDVVVSQCSFIGGTADARWPDIRPPIPLTYESGILLNNADSVRIAGNYFTHMVTPAGSAIVVQSNSSVVRIVNNVFDDLFGVVLSRYDDQNPDPNDPYFRGNN